ncbi:DUF3886 domain-containing protein [Thalassobacillus pellis]|uniref:DUF3886 domain-containing protein n=1 Tax=Thalassobacillus pellis TaxID=748008 RepID=UPI00195FE121|nr:hypothetical protein [Thalassobacillus pellis]
MSKKERVSGSGSLKDRLNPDLWNQLQSKKTEWKQAEKEQQEKERQRLVRERKEREANKSFEELLEESDIDWKKYK